MANDSAEQIYELLKRYLFPILKFANIYVDEKGILRPDYNKSIAEAFRI